MSEEVEIAKDWLTKLEAEIDQMKAHLDEALERVDADSQRLDTFLTRPWSLINEDGDFPTNREEFDRAAVEEPDHE